MLKILSDRNEKLLCKGKLLVGYITAGYPTEQDFLEVISGCDTNGVDIFEVGYPSANPHSDGEIIKKAHHAIDFSAVCCISCWEKVRNITDKPIWIMGYAADLIKTNAYIELAKAQVADAFVIPDLESTQIGEVAEKLSQFNVDFMPFVEYGIENLENWIGKYPLLYYQLVTGKTGCSFSNEEDFTEITQLLKRNKNTYVFGGFGISAREHVEEILDAGFSGAIVGTAMLAHLNKSKESLFSFVRELKAFA